MCFILIHELLRLREQTLVIPAWEVSPEELRWEAHQEMKETGACVKYQIQMRLMQKDAQTYRERVIREILGPEVATAAAVDLYRCVLIETFLACGKRPLEPKTIEQHRPFLFLH